MGQYESKPLRDVRLTDKYALDTTRAYMTGIEALVRLPILQHQRTSSGAQYRRVRIGLPGLPLGSVDQALWNAAPFLNQHNVHFQPGVNEELAATAVWGSQQTQLFQGARYDGVFGMWYGKGPGVDRSMDVIKHANAFGTAQHGGVLAVAEMTLFQVSTLPHQSSTCLLAPRSRAGTFNVQEVLDLGIFGWELSVFRLLGGA